MGEVRFNNARGAASSLQMTPPFAFSDVTMSVFPLRASLPSLESFCAHYLNQEPDLLQFRPFIPFVYLVILDYGRMSLEAANLGWVSQREVAFGVPLRWLNGGETGPEFYDWAFSSPFIFVDNELSMSTGREVYGWPKLLARLDPSVSEWVRDPHGARRVFQVSTKGAAQGYTGETSSYLPLLSVYQHRTAGLLDMPPSLDAVTKPLSQMSGAMASMSRLSMDLAKTFVGMASDRITGSALMPDLMDLETFRDQLQPDRMKDWTSAGKWMPGLKDALWSLYPRLYSNTINFKQFRDAGNPHGTCYQAITAARMPVKSFKQGGFLGPQNMLLGQLDGGFSIDIHHLAGLPIIDSLGLEVSSTRVSGDTTVSTLSPVAPLWLKVDMSYGVADTLIWNKREGSWREGEFLAGLRKDASARRAQASASAQEPDVEFHHETPPPAADTTAPDAGKGLARTGAKDDDAENAEDLHNFDYIRAMNTFNTARGGSEAVGGAFSLPDASMRVLPLKADAAVLRTFVRDYLRVEDKMRFEAWGDFVYLIISDFNEMNSEVSARAKRRSRELSLMVPVKCYQWFRDGQWNETGLQDRPAHDRVTKCARGEKELLTTGFVNAFTYVDDVETAITLNEVFGVPSMGSTIVASENDWLSRDYGYSKSDYEILRMDAQVLPELMVGAEAVERTLVEVSSHHIHHEDTHETELEAINKWVGMLADDLQAKSIEAGLSQSPSEETLDIEWHHSVEDEIRDGPERNAEAVNVGQGFALKLLGGGMAFNQFSLKQFRDSRSILNACYQGLVMRRHRIQKLKDFREIDGPLHVSITDYPTQPITQILGLKPKHSYPGPDGEVKVFEAVRPFSINADIHRGAGITLYERIETDGWEPVNLTDQMFGWRELDRDGIRNIQDQFDPNDCVDVAHEVRMPGGDSMGMLGPKEVPVRWLPSWYGAAENTERVGRILVRKRDVDATVSVLADESRQDLLRPENKPDLAAWNNQMADKEEAFSQCAAAAKVERFSPATIIDRVLARRWGRSHQETEHTAARRPDFCLPVSSVPEIYAETLFPPAERQHGYWPQSDTFFDGEFSRRRGEVIAFKMEIASALRALTFALPLELGDAEGLDMLGSDFDFDALAPYIQSVGDALVTHLEGSDREHAVHLANHALNRIKEDDYWEKFERLDGWEVLGLQTVEMVMHFFNAHLPGEFRVGDERGMTLQEETLTLWRDLRDGHTGLIDADTWHKLAEDLRRLGRNVFDLLDESAGAVSWFNMFLKAFIERAERNCAEMKLVESAEKSGGSQSQTLGHEPYDVLRSRLSALVTDGTFQA